MLAPRSMSSRTVLTCPFHAARVSAVSPSCAQAGVRHGHQTGSLTAISSERQCMTFRLALAIVHESNSVCAGCQPSWWVCSLPGLASPCPPSAHMTPRPPHISARLLPRARTRSCQPFRSVRQVGLKVAAVNRHSIALLLASGRHGRRCGLPLRSHVVGGLDVGATVDEQPYRVLVALPSGQMARLVAPLRVEHAAHHCRLPASATR